MAQVETQAFREFVQRDGHYSSTRRAYVENRLQQFGCLPYESIRIQDSGVPAFHRMKCNPAIDGSGLYHRDSVG